jgi:hypothetical protein
MLQAPARDTGAGSRTCTADPRATAAAGRCGLFRLVEKWFSTRPAAGRANSPESALTLSVATGASDALRCRADSRNGNRDLRAQRSRRLTSGRQRMGRYQRDAVQIGAPRSIARRRANIRPLVAWTEVRRQFRHRVAALRCERQ